MNWVLSSETRRKYIRVGSAPASLQERVSKLSTQSMPLSADMDAVFLTSCIEKYLNTKCVLSR